VGRRSFTGDDRRFFFGRLAGNGQLSQEGAAGYRTRTVPSAVNTTVTRWPQHHS
jgi:hypothetical protein